MLESILYGQSVLPSLVENFLTCVLGCLCILFGAAVYVLADKGWKGSLKLLVTAVTMFALATAVR